MLDQPRQTRHLYPLHGDFYLLRETLTAGEQAIAQQVRTFMEMKVAPVINQYWADDAFPFELLPAFKELGIGGLGMKGYGCRGESLKLCGMVAMELARSTHHSAPSMGA